MESLEGLGSADGGILIDAGNAGDLDESSVFDPLAKIVFEPPAIVVEPLGDRGLIQGDHFEIAWNGLYVFVWLENISSRLFVVTATFDPRDHTLTTPVILSADYDDGGDAPQSLALISRQDGFAIVWSTERDLYFHALDAFGRPLGAPVHTWQHDQGAALALTLLASDTKLVVLAAPPGGASLPTAFAFTLQPDGTMIEPETSTVASGLAVLHHWSHHLSIMAAPEGELPGTDFSVFYYDEKLVPYPFPPSSRSAGGTDAIYFGPPGDGEWYAVWSLDSGAIWDDLHDMFVGTALSPSGERAPVIAHDPDFPRLVLLHATGEYSADNMLPNRLEARALQYLTRREPSEERTVIYDGAPANSCVEHVRTAVAGKRLGVAFLTGCPDRKLRFIELRGVDTL
jgi:hypothetical protein